MKKIILVIIMALATSIIYAKVNSGGVSLDFAQLPSFNKKAETIGQNLLLDGTFQNTITSNPMWRLNQFWTGHAWVHGKSKNNDAIQKLCSRTIKDGIVTIKTPKEILQYLNAKGEPAVSNKISQMFKIPEANQPRKIVYSMDLKNVFENTPANNGLWIFSNLYKLDENGKRVQVGKMLQKALPASKGEFQKITSDVIVPAGITSVQVTIAIYGIGELQIRDVSATFAEAEKTIDVLAYPAGMLDNLFQIGRNQSGTIAFSYKNDTGRKIRTFDLELDLPKGVEFLDTHYNAKVISQTKDKVVIRFNGVFRGKGDYEPWFVLPVLIKSKLPVGSKVKLPYRSIENSNYSAYKYLNLEVIEPITKASTPKIFQTGCMFAHENNFTDKGAKQFVQDYKNLGFNLVHGGSSKEVINECGKQKIARYTQPHMLCNGYRLGEGQKSDDLRFQLIDGTLKSDMSMCPIGAISEIGYNKHIKPLLEKIIKNYEHIMPNWEVHGYDNQGCFCNKCRDAFIIYMKDKANAQDVKNKWPKQIIASYKNDWVKFRSLQHAELVGFLDKKIKEIGATYGKKVNFIPELSIQSFNPYRKSHYEQYLPDDYLDKVEWLDPWGPYIFANRQQPYIYYPGIQLIHFEAMKQIRKVLPKNKLINLPHGVQGLTWFTEPEAVAFEFLNCFVTGWEGAIGYYYPKGYDHRYLKASAIANTQIAKYENIVFNGKNAIKDVEVSSKTPLPKPFYPHYWSEGGNFVELYPELKNSKMLQTVAFQYQNKLLIATGNFWQKGENFHSIKVKNLKANQKYVVTLDNQSLGTFTGKELAKGFLSHTGALRWSFILIQPTSKSIKATISQCELQDLMKKRLPNIQKNYQWEQEYYKKFHEEASTDLAHNDFSIFYTVTNGNIKLEAKNERLIVTTPNYNLSIDPATGGVIDKFISKNESLIDEKGYLDAIGFWVPNSVLIKNGFTIINSGMTKNGVYFELSRKVSKRDGLAYAGLNLVRRYEFELNKIILSTKIENQTNKPISFAFRSHNFPMGYSTKKSQTGKMIFADGTTFTRDYKIYMYRYAKDDKRINNAHGKKIFVDVKSSEATFQAPFLQKKLIAKPEEEKIQSFYLWDSAGTTPSFEPIYKYITLQPKNSVDYSITWEVAD